MFNMQIRDHIMHKMALGAEWIGPAKDAVSAMADGESDAEIDAPLGHLWPNGKEFMLAASVVRLLELGDFVKEEVDDDVADEDLEFYE